VRREQNGVVLLLAERYFSVLGVVQVRPINRPAIKSRIRQLLTRRTSNNELLLTIAEDHLMQNCILFQALADGLNLATDYSIRSTYYHNYKYKKNKIYYYF